MSRMAESLQTGHNILFSHKCRFQGKTTSCPFCWFFGVLWLYFFPFVWKYFHRGKEIANNTECDEVLIILRPRQKEDEKLRKVARCETTPIKQHQNSEIHPKNAATVLRVVVENHKWCPGVSLGNRPSVGPGLRPEYWDWRPWSRAVLGTIPFTALVFCGFFRGTSTSAENTSQILEDYVHCGERRERVCAKKIAYFFLSPVHWALVT